ncbi:hypothetical protein [Sphingomonas sp. PR090111-T3T-6A]|uniref:hypothetical protein n=1 Tax=Sphingomonas sp. PR090111-T3T-6A TaxID=685778 RepID=UPI00036247F3|nr:hypothetical protein [Sphingomonas sp. PR090111-T3T-6A]
MGEARDRLERLRETFLASAEQWMFPPSRWEQDAVREILALPVERAIRGVPRGAAVLNAPTRECHTNAAFYAEHDPTGRATMVTGWWRQPNVLVLHSLVEIDGQLYCVTPFDADPSRDFPFIRDPKLRWREDEAGERYCERDGHRIGPGLRLDAPQVMADTALIKDRLESGMNPYEAVKVAIGSGSRRRR